MVARGGEAAEQGGRADDDVVLTRVPCPELGAAEVLASAGSRSTLGETDPVRVGGAMASRPSVRSGGAADVRRRRTLLIAWVTVAVATLHFLDHVIRGYYVIDHGLDPSWNHSGWPFLPQFTPFTASLIGVYGVLGVGIWLTTRGRVGAGYWLMTALLLGALVVWVHFLGAQAETPAVIYRSWGDPVAGVVAVVNTVAVLAAVLAMGVNAVVVGVRSGWQAEGLRVAGGGRS